MAPQSATKFLLMRYLFVLVLTSISGVQLIAEPSTRPPRGPAAAPEALAKDWLELGHFLHGQCTGASAWILSGNPELTRHLGLRANRKWPVRNGPIECRWIRYDIATRRQAPPAE